MLIGGVGETGLAQTNEQITFPIGGVGAGALQEERQPGENGD